MNIIPLLLGGGQERGLRSGTVAVPQAVALAKAARMVTENMEQSMNKYRKWFNDLYEFLTGFGENIHILSTKSGAAHILSFSVKDLKGEILINALQSRGIIVSTSSACSSRQKKTSHVVESLKVNANYKKGVIRLSFGLLNTDDDMEAFKKAFTEVMNELKGDNN